eukprot:1157384-Pelagomonas_calceolata.AAC.3
MSALQQQRVVHRRSVYHFSVKGDRWKERSQLPAWDGAARCVAYSGNMPRYFSGTKVAWYTILDKKRPVIPELNEVHAHVVIHESDLHEAKSGNRCGTRNDFRESATQLKLHTYTWHECPPSVRNEEPLCRL